MLVDFSDHRDDLQHGAVLRHQEQQGGYINRCVGSPPPSHRAAGPLNCSTPNLPPSNVRLHRKLPSSVLRLHASDVPFLSWLAPSGGNGALLQSHPPAHEDFFLDKGMFMTEEYCCKYRHQFFCLFVFTSTSLTGFISPLVALPL